MVHIVIHKGPKNIKSNYKTKTIFKAPVDTSARYSHQIVVFFKHQYFDSTLLLFFFLQRDKRKRVTLIEWKRGGWSSAQVGQVAFPAAHLAARHGQDAVYVPSAQLRAQAQAQALQAALLPQAQTWNN